MFLWIKKRKIISGLATAAILLGLGAALRYQAVVQTMSVGESSDDTVLVIDAGHGGEDGGAVANDGTVESGINLAVSLRLQELLLFCGTEVVMTRTEDISIYSEEAETLRQKKVSDLKNRVALVNSLPNTVLISIHQNSMPTAPSVHGGQAFYNTVDGSAEYAASIQKSLNTVANPANPKSEKEIPSTIYLMKNITAPGVLVECGFLSNQTELSALKTPAYQMQLALAIASGYYNTEDGEALLP